MNQHIIDLEVQLDKATSAHEQITLLHEIAWFHAINDARSKIANCLTQANQIMGDVVINLSTRASYDILNVCLMTIDQGYPAALGKALEIETAYQGSIDAKWRARLACVIGLIHGRLGNSDEAIKAYYQTVEIAESIGDVHSQHLGLTGVAVILGTLNDMDNALKYFQASLHIAEEHKLHEREFTSHHNLCQLYLMRGEIEAAEEAARASICLAQQQGQAHDKAFATSRIAMVYQAQGAYEDARDTLEDALSILPQEKSYWHSSIILKRLLGMTYFFLQDYVAARRVLEDVLAEILTRNSLIHALEVYPPLIETYERMGNFQQAFLTQRAYFGLHRQMNDDRSVARIQSLEVMYKTHEAETQLEHQRMMTEQAILQTEQTKHYFEELNTMKTDFIDSATHDLKNPLSSIRMNAEMLRMKIPKEFHRHLDRIERNTERMNGLISDMLDIAKLETGNAIEPKLHNFNQVVMSVVGMYQVFANEKSITIHTQLTEQPVQFFFDVHYIERCLNNLVSNAIKYSPENTTLTLQMDVINNIVEIQVSDEGYGIPAAALAHIFDRFYRVDHETTSKMEGTGLGLSIVRTIIEQHGGEITVDSILGEGTTFTINLPYITELNTYSSSA